MKNNIDKPLDIAVDQKLNQLADNITSLVNETKSHLVQVLIRLWSLLIGILVDILLNLNSMEC